MGNKLSMEETDNLIFEIHCRNTAKTDMMPGIKYDDRVQQLMNDQKVRHEYDMADYFFTTRDIVQY